MNDRLARAWLPMAVCCLLGAAAPCVAQVSTAPQIRQGVVSPAMQYIALMGQVSQPGVYECRAPIELSDVVKRAGGLTGDASGNIRLVRQGRSGQQMRFSPDVRFQLVAGDLLIADGKPNGFAQTGSAGATGVVQNGIGASARRSGVIQIGIVQLLDWPVVLEIPSHRATVRDVWGLLNQPPTSAAPVTVLKPGAGQQTVAVNQTPPVALTSGTVLVFDRRSIIATTLPVLPQPIRMVDVEPATIKPATVPEPIAEQVPATAAAVVPAEPAPVATPDPVVPAQIFDALKPQVEQSNPIANVPPPPEPAVTTHELPPAPQRVPVPNVGALTSNPLAVPEPTDVPPPNTTSLKPAQASRPKSSEKAATGTPTSSAAIILLVVVGVFILTLRVLQRFERRQSHDAKTEHHPVDHSLRLLDALIENRLPFVEESLIIPRGVHLYGRALETGRHRLDAPQAIQPPHFLPRPEKIADDAGQFVPTPKSEARVVPAPHIHSAVQKEVVEAHAAPRLLDRVLLSVHGGKR